MNRSIAAIAVSALIAWNCTGVALPPPESQQDREVLQAAMEVPTTFVMGPADANGAWTRAKVWVEMYSDTKIREANGAVIETYTPTAKGEFGYSVHRIPAQDSGATFSVTCTPYAGKESGDLAKAEQNAHLLTFYMTSGRVTARYVYRVQK